MGIFIKNNRLAIQRVLGLLLLLIIAFPDAANAAPRFARSTGTWTAVTWSATSCAAGTGAAVPAAGDDVTICSGFTVTLNASTAALNSLDVQGTLTFGNNATARTLTVTGNVTVSGTVNVSNNTITHSFVLGGNLANSGTFDLVLDANSLCNTTMNGAGPQIVSGAGATTEFNNVAVTNSLTINSGATVTQTGTLTVGGTLAVSAGTINLNNVVTVTGPTNVTGGTLNMGGAVAGNRTYTGLVTVSGAGNWTNTGNRVTVFQGGITHTGTGNFTNGTGAVTFNTGATQVLDGDAAAAQAAYAAVLVREPDNAQALPGGKGYGPPILPEAIVQDYTRLREADPSRPVLLNLGQGVAFDNYIGRGVRRNHPEDYASYLQGCDIASFDIYPVVHQSPEVSGKLEFVARDELVVAVPHASLVAAGAPVIVGRQRLGEPTLGAIIINNKISNVCAPGGVEASEQICAATAKLLHLAPAQVLPSSTGVIGWGLPVDAMLGALPAAAAALAGGSIMPAAEGIVTTDLYPKVRSATVGAGTPISSAFTLVHLPVPFWPAVSRMTSTSGLPVSGSFCLSTLAVISMRKEFRSPLFHSSKVVPISSGVMPRRPRMRS